MKHDIIRKLEKVLAVPITSEPQVVYFLVEIRKLLEHKHRERKTAGLRKDETYATLEFCCDWAVHPVMDWENGKRIVRRFNQYQELLEQIRTAKDGEPVNTNLSFLTEFGSTIRLSKFREQLGAFLSSNGLDTSVANDNAKWADFLALYAEVIKDCPLKCSDEELKFTDEVTLTVLDVQASTSGEYRVVLEWRWVSKITGMETVNQQFY